MGRLHQPASHLGSSPRALVRPGKPPWPSCHTTCMWLVHRKAHCLRRTGSIKWKQHSKTALLSHCIRWAFSQDDKWNCKLWLWHCISVNESSLLHDKLSRSTILWQWQSCCYAFAWPSWRCLQVATISMWELRLVLLVKPEYQNKISHIQQSSVKTGIANALGRELCCNCFTARLFKKGTWLLWEENITLWHSIKFQVTKGLLDSPSTSMELPSALYVHIWPQGMKNWQGAFTCPQHLTLCGTVDSIVTALSRWPIEVSCKKLWRSWWLSSGPWGYIHSECKRNDEVT